MPNIYLLINGIEEKEKKKTKRIGESENNTSVSSPANHTAAIEAANAFQLCVFKVVQSRT